jgi:hypothetical protein
MSLGSDTKVRCWARWSETSKGNLDLASAAPQLRFGQNVDFSAAAGDRIVIVKGPRTWGKSDSMRVSRREDDDAAGHILHNSTSLHPSLSGNGAAASQAVPQHLHCLASTPEKKARLMRIPGSPGSRAYRLYDGGPSNKQAQNTPAPALRCRFVVGIS